MFSFADTQSLQIASSNNSKYQEVLLVASKSEQFANTCNSSNDSSTNLLAIRVVNGKQNWEKNITDMQYMNCSLIDANKDGRTTFAEIRSAIKRKHHKCMVGVR